MVTSLSCLTLEIYYRYLPIYQTEKESNNKAEPTAEPEPKEAGDEVALESTEVKPADVK